MGDLDELASAARGEQRHPPAGIPEYAPPERRRFRALPWVILGTAIAVAVAALGAYELVQRSLRQHYGSMQQNYAGMPPPPLASPAPTPAPLAASSQPAARPGPTRTRLPLEDIDDPFQALDIYHLKRGVGDTIEIKARNRSKRGLFIKSVELYAASNDRAPLDNIGFWLPPGDMVVATREVLELSRRLGPNEAISAVINEAEFRDAAPEEITDQPSGTSTRPDAQ